MNAITSDLESLAQLARHDEFADRGDLLISLGALLISDDRDLAEKQREHCISLIIELLNDCSLDDRIALAELIGTSSRTPRQIILTLAKSHIAAAVIILEQSPVLREQDLIDIARTTSPDHCKAMAARKDITEKVSDAIISNGDEETLKALINNHGADIAKDDMARLVAIAKRFPILALPLLQRPNISRRNAEEIAESSSMTVKDLVARMAPTPSLDPSRSERTRKGKERLATDQQVRAQQKINSLKQSGRLRTAFLVKALHENDEQLFIAAFAEFLDLATSFVARLLKPQSPSAMALAYRALGGSRQQFETILLLYRNLKNRPTTLTPQDRSEIDRIFQSVSQDSAQRALTSLLST